MIGTKIYKTYIENPDGGLGYETYGEELYVRCAEWCNETGLATIEDKGEYYEVIAIPAPSLDELKTQKINELKSIRDTEEVKPIAYNGNLFDFDDKARDRINSAIIALSITGQSIEWTTADNTNVTVTTDDLRGVVANVAVRSNELHVRYRELKELVEACTTKEELDIIQW